MQRVFYNATLDVYSKYGNPACGAQLDSAIAQLSSSAVSFDELSAVFVTCDAVQSKADVERLVFYVKGAVATLAMLDYPCTFVHPAVHALWRGCCPCDVNHSVDCAECELNVCHRRALLLAHQQIPARS